MTPAEIVKQHRKDLVRRLLSRNPLLNFRPQQRGTKVDVCSLFGEHISNDALSQFLYGVIQNDADPVDLSSESTKKYLAPLRKLQSDALDAYRATGRWDLALAWPLLHIPRGGARNPYCAPLLFWKIEIKIQGQEAKFSLHEDEVEFNFMLKAYLEEEEHIKLAWDDDKEDIDLDVLASRIKKTFEEAKWSKCQNYDSFGDGGLVNKYEYDKEDNKAVLTPCAVIGKAGFSYRPLLEELNELYGYLQQESPKGLLRELLIGPDGVGESFPAKEPKPADRWLVTDDSDATQEASIWQARQEKIMLIKGPPGTGKSQTIVNLIADAVQRGERVVLACQKKPALDVIRQRLGSAGHNLDSIVQQIDEPRKNRRAIIKKVKEIGENDPIRDSVSLFDERNVLCESIAQSESECVLPDEGECVLPDNGKILYSIRGDLLAKISRIKNETGFNPSITRSEPFISEIKEAIIKEAINEPFNQSESNQWGKRIKGLVNDWERCNYRKNPWYPIAEEWDTEGIPRLFGDCEELREIFSLIAAQRELLPAHAFLNLAASPLMIKYFHVFFGGEQRETVRLLCRLISDTRQLFLKSAGMKEVAPLWNTLFKGNTDDNPYKYYGSHCDDISIIQTIHKRLREHKALQIITDKYPDQRAEWEDILLAAISKLRLDKMPFRRYDYERAVEHLKDGISSKKELDKDNILTRFSQRGEYVRELQRQDLLRLNAGGGRPSTSLRKLYHQGNDSIWKIYPVLLANPDTLCQILPNKPGSIDMVIIDEASQMFTADALPIFHRAKKIIISGDNKQMPPADFFSVAAGDDTDDEDDGEDDQVYEKGVAAAQGRFELFEMAEHLLAARGAAACCDLEVHYRSRPAELIAFSNHAFYDGKLQTAPYNDFPPECMKRPIEMERIPGIFEKGVNQEEIKAVIEKLRVIWAVNPPPSVGVIVFNTTQASALKDAINETCENDVDFRKKYDRANDADEDTEFFVRSVENVQGDERDIIILATTYGERRNYGPISRIEKGRRRLNVAITRAKKGMFVITSLDIGNISNQGEHPDGNPGEGKERWYLWMYMRYARAVSDGNDEEAKIILREINPKYEPRPTGREPDSEFEVDVAKFLRNQGYHVDYQIGESGFRIDLGVKREGDTRYLCGVECDGRTWHSGWRARHNDIWRQKVLESKGWKIVRIWSDKWYNASEEDRGKELLEEIRVIEQKLMQKAEVE